MIVGFTGTQRGMTEQQKTKLKTMLSRMFPKEFHHGDCIGADAEAHEIAEMLDLWIVTHPPLSGAKRAFKWANESRLPKPYLERNKDIVNECDLLLVAPKTEGEELRSGTWSTYRYAKKQGKRIEVIAP